MRISIHSFGIAKEIVGGTITAIDIPDQSSVSELISALKENYPRLQALSSFAIAINGNYAAPDTVIALHDEVAIIPPVSGG